MKIPGIGRKEAATVLFFSGIAVVIFAPMSSATVAGMVVVAMSFVLAFKIKGD